jgi:alginate biosynthesis protein AlgX
MHLKHVLPSVLFSLLCASAFVAPASAEPTAGKKAVFTCPDLTNTDKQTISEMVQGYDGWFFRLQGDLREDFQLFEEASNYITRLVNIFKQRGTTMVFLSVPSKGIVAHEHLDMSAEKLRSYQLEAAKESYGQFVTQMAKTGLLIPNIQQALEGQKDKIGSFFFKRDHHWTSDGARMGAQAIGEMIRNAPEYKNLKPATYVSKQSGTQMMKHKMALELQRLCQTEMPPEEYPRYNTSMEQAADASGEDALFGDVGGGGDPVALVGSSFSAEEEFNFDGFLSEYTGLPIANHAISGGLLFNAIISYTSSPQFEQEQPPFIIWEAPAIYNLNENASTAFRQIIPALYGECQGNDVVAETTQEIKAGVIEGNLFSFSSDQSIKGQNYYLFISSPNRSFSSFTLNAEYDDGDGEWFSVDREEFFDNSGRFFIELSDEIESNLASLSIERASNVNTTIAAKLCRVPEKYLTTQPKE